MRLLRKPAALLLALILLLPLAGVPCRAAESYIITVAEDTVLEDTADPGMAMYLDGIIYVPYTTLQKLKGAYASYNEKKSLVTVYRVGYMMYFELDTGLTYNQENRYVQVSAKLRSGVPYLPVQVICSWMGLYFSYTAASSSGVGYPIMRLAKDTPRTSDEELYQQQAETLQSVARSRDLLSGIVTPETPGPVTPEPAARDISLIFAGAPEGELSFLLDTLEGAQTPAAFFLPAGQLTALAEPLRELYARGFSPGLLLEGEDLLAEARAGSETCARLLHTRVRLVTCRRALTEEELAALSEAGFVPVLPDRDLYAEGVEQKKLLSALKKLLRTGGDGQTLLLKPDSATQELLPVVCSYLVAQNYTALPVREWR